MARCCAPLPCPTHCLPKRDVIERYVYYRIDPLASDAMRRDVLEMQHSLRQRFPGLQTRLLRRVDARGETLMEIYTRPHDARGVDDAVLAEIESLAAGFVSGRRIESFEPCAS